MTTIYTTDSMGVFAGVQDVDAYAPMPPRSTLTPPPAVVGAQVARLTAGAWEVLPAYPEPPAPDIAALKAAKNAEINAARLAANFSTFTHGGKTFACDQLSRSDIDGTNGFVSLYGSMPPGWPGGWKAVDNTYTPITTVADWKAFYASLFAAGNANFAHSQVLKAALNNATTAEQIAAIHWGMQP
jgi:hypothetical protein